MVSRGESVYTEAHKRRLKLLERALTGSVINLLHHREIVCQNERLTTEKQHLQNRLGHIPASRIIGAESGLRGVMQLVHKVAPLASPVLIIGETGVGKEVIAVGIHETSNRAQQPMISINCGAIPETLIDSELFGHEKGAFTSAERRKRGYFEQANGGTIFLDEIGELPLKAQVKLLRVLQTMAFQRVGGTREISVDVRVIAATNRDLKQMVRNNQFREDLWFRLNVFPIQIPPLRERLEDIPSLAEYFLLRKAREMNLATPPGLSPKALAQLGQYPWPGNIRELQNVIERALIISDTPWLEFPNLEMSFSQHPPSFSSDDDVPFLTMGEMMIRHIKAALKLSRGRIEGPQGAARRLGMNPSTLRGRMRKYRIRIEKRVD